MNHYSRQRINLEKQRIGKAVQASRNQELNQAKRNLQQVIRQPHRRLSNLGHQRAAHSRDQASRIPQPKLSGLKQKPQLQKGRSKIPKLWKKGDLLDSLDLSVSKPKGEIEETKNTVDIRQSINQWAPQKQWNFGDTAEFLQNELHCVQEEENKLEMSIARLDRIAHKQVLKRDIEDLDRETQKLKESIKKYEPEEDDHVRMDSFEEKDSEASQRSCMSRKDARTKEYRNREDSSSINSCADRIKTNPNVDIQALFSD